MVQIRKALITDAERIAEIYLSSFRNAFHDYLPHEYLYSKFKIVRRITTIQKAIENNSIDFFVYEENNLILGFLSSGKCENADMSNSYAIFDLFVESKMIGLGIGSQLLSYAEVYALELSYDKLVLWTFDFNIKAIKLYEKCGYVKDNKSEYLEDLKATEIRFVKEVKKWK